MKTNIAPADESRGGKRDADAGLAFQLIQIERERELAVLICNDPPANTLTYDMVVQLEEALFELSLDRELRAIIVTGAGERFFSGGVNIGMLRTSSAHYNSNFLLYAAEVFELIETNPLLVVAAINGHVTGGGLELALVADHRIAAAGTYNFGFPEVRLGVIPGLGGTQRLARLIGPRAALELITHGDFISVNRAETLGIVEAIRPKANFLQAAIEFTREKLRNLPAPTRRVVPTLTWQRPRESLATYERQGRIGVITLTRECPNASALQVAWSLNRAILWARLDDGVDALLITHAGGEFRFGRADSLDDHAWRYAQFVLDRLESFPRLCVFAFGTSLDLLATELALACEYRLLTSDRGAKGNPDDVILRVPAASNRYMRYLPPRAPAPSSDVSLTISQAEKQDLLRPLEAGSSLDPILTWMARFVAPRGASKAIGYAKTAIVKGASLPPAAGVLIERHLQEQLFRGHDGPEGMQAYLEKRSPVFQGA
jgi:enoyl-CoA hydratase